jgi:hypothetical protein
MAPISDLSQAESNSITDSTLTSAENPSPLGKARITQDRESILTNQEILTLAIGILTVQSEELSTEARNVLWEYFFRTRTYAPKSILSAFRMELVQDLLDEDTQRSAARLESDISVLQRQDPVQFEMINLIVDKWLILNGFRKVKDVGDLDKVLKEEAEKRNSLRRRLGYMLAGETPNSENDLRKQIGVVDEQLVALLGRQNEIQKSNEELLRQGESRYQELIGKGEELFQAIISGATHDAGEIRQAAQQAGRTILEEARALATEIVNGAKAERLHVEKELAARSRRVELLTLEEKRLEERLSQLRVEKGDLLSTEELIRFDSSLDQEDRQRQEKELFDVVGDLSSILNTTGIPREEKYSRLVSTFVDHILLPLEKFELTHGIQSRRQTARLLADRLEGVKGELPDLVVHREWGNRLPSVITYHGPFKWSPSAARYCLRLSLLISDMRRLSLHSETMSGVLFELNQKYDLFRDANELSEVFSSLENHPDLKVFAAKRFRDECGD